MEPVVEQLLDKYTEDEIIDLACMTLEGGNRVEAYAEYVGYLAIMNQSALSKDAIDKATAIQYLSILMGEIPLDEVPLYIYRCPKLCQWRLKIGR